MSEIVEVFGKFAVEIEGEVQMYETHSEAEIAKNAFEHAEDFYNRGVGFCEAHDITGKNLKGKVNIISAFLAWEAAGSPERVVEEETEEAVNIVA